MELSSSLTHLPALLFRLFDQMIWQVPFVGNLFASKWNLIHNEGNGSFALLSEQGPLAIPHRYAVDDLAGKSCLRLGAGSGQIRTITLPAAASANLHEAVRLQLDTISPLPHEDTAFAITGKRTSIGAGAGQIEVDIALASKTRLQQILDKAAQAGMNISCVDVLNPNNILAEPVIDLRTGKAASAGIRPSLVMGVLLALMLLVAGGLHIWTSLKLEPQVNAFQTLASPKGAKIARQHFEARLIHRSIVHVWHEVTRAMPDQAWLESMTISSGQLRIAGHAENAAALVPLLEANPVLQNVRLAAASVQDDDGGESFELQADIVGREADT